MSRSARVCLLCASACALAGSITIPAAAQQSRRFIEVSRHVQDIDSEFDDSILLTSPTLVVNVPALREANGIGFAFGAVNDGTSFAFSYVKTDPEATSLLGDTIAQHRQYGLDVAIAPWLGQGPLSLSPTIRLGTAYTRLKIPGAATDGVDVGDANFSSLGLHLGFGGLLQVGNALHVTVGYERRYLKFRNVDGLGESVRIRDGLSATGDVLVFGVGLYIPG